APLARARRPDLVERLADLVRRGIPPHGLLVRLLGLEEEARLAKDRPGVDIEPRVLGVERERGLQGTDRRPHVSRAGSGEPEVMMRPRVLGVPERPEPEIARGLRVAFFLVGGDSLGD